MTVNPSFAEWLRAPAVPLTVTAKFPAEAFEGIDRVTSWLFPAPILKGKAGEVNDPTGKPENVTATESENPF